MSASSSLDSISSTLNTLQLVLISYLTTFYTWLHAILPPPVQAQLDSLTVTLDPYMTRSNAQYMLRIVVIISTYLLFRPHLEALFRKASNTPDARQVELENRLQFLREVKEGKVKPTGGVEVVDGKVVLKPNRPEAGGKKGKGGGGKVVKFEENTQPRGEKTGDAASTPNKTPKRRKA